MKYTLLNCPDSEWKRGFEKQVRKRKVSIEKSLQTAVMPVKVGYEWELGFIKQILGDKP